MKFSESDMLDPLYAWLKNLPDAEIYTEVDYYGMRPDVVVKQGNIISTFELKKSLSIAVLDQAIRNSKYAHFTWIVVPCMAKKMYGKDFHVRRYSYTLDCVVDNFGIGIIEIDMLDYHNFLNRTNRYSHLSFLKEDELHADYVFRNKTYGWLNIKWAKVNRNIVKDYSLKSRLLPEFLYENQGVAGVKGKYKNVNKIANQRLINHLVSTEARFSTAKDSEWRKEGYFHPSDADLVDVLRTLYSSPSSKIVNIFMSNESLFDTKMFGRKKCYKLKSDVDINSKELWFNYSNERSDNCG